MAFITGFGQQAPMAPAATPGMDVGVDVSDIPNDSVSEMAFSPTHDYLAVGSWNNEVRIYEVNAQGQTMLKSGYTHEGPVLSVCWSPDGTKVLSAGADNAGRMFDLATSQTTQIAAHDQPIKCIRAFRLPDGQTIAVTGSWDKTLKYWSLGQTTPMVTVPLKERVYVMSLRYPWLVVGLAERQIEVFDLQNPSVPAKSMLSPLKFQTRSTDIFIEGGGFAVGSVEGRVAIHQLDEKNVSGSFSFRCHRKDLGNREPTKVFSVNSIQFHPFGTFATAGADGSIVLWDKDSRTRLKQFANLGGPVINTCFNASGTIMAYAIGNDWSKGYSTNTPDYINKIRLLPLKEEDVQKKNKKK